MLRQDWYLATLGIVRYVPRGRVVAEFERIESPPADIAAGRGSLRQLLADEAPSRVVSSQATPAVAQTSVASRAAEPVLAALSQQNTSPITAVDAVSSLLIESDAGSDEEIRARLAVWQPAPDLLFFDSLAPDGQPSLQMARLVSNITASLGRKGSAAAMPQLLDWPPARSRVTGDLQAARAMITAFCDARLSGEQVRLALVLGSDAVRLLLPDGDGADLTTRTCRWRDLDAVIAPALSDLLGDAAGKRDLWRALAPFARKEV